ncbi:DUF3389 family protein [Shewanella sp. NIFS-20-20]|uniref:DUF3389 family protein n=1 Tax=Shewanella sp. NIFS-20-20 TaxID=2853806 RepID=UPI001C46DF00|nr:DUF3389 family protein [Shewanella sp. NIFS-20-20]MBV7314331.1 DUF3389 family protein [Shewanella sp. NIFS-20-20]
MILDIPLGKLIVTAQEVQVRLTSTGVMLQSFCDDLIILPGPLLLADAGAVRWSLPITQEVADLMVDFIGPQLLKR